MSPTENLGIEVRKINDDKILEKCCVVNYYKKAFENDSC